MASNAGHGPVLVLWDVLLGGLHASDLGFQPQVLE